ncbi:MAG: hypothetical protein GFH27_549303n179 [Chloroflexi bacterium AL-W]|nr:hypothetical protein [Chloroflexi bacterium AL-N1]NOK68064.1 hypothetical protein [Chloroflexi bacterium AL-N10]NOK73404.1 hypothetical protein [Chloroflexi bacterium AL-N5]NOK83318.1 hypothetical protein [Chloroflexi bacterium AL-W]NOK87735.1 hypothetical protein [Chloroflexi bacterium AL-N15]
MIEVSEVIDNPAEYIGQSVITCGYFPGIVETDYPFKRNDPALLGLDSLLIVGADRTIVHEDETFCTPG